MGKYSLAYGYATLPAAEGEGGDQKDPLMAAAANFAQPWPLL
jgi:hypothetical protein